MRNDEIGEHDRETVFYERTRGLAIALARAFLTWSDKAEPSFDRYRLPLNEAGRRVVISIEIVDDDAFLPPSSVE